MYIAAAGFILTCFSDGVGVVVVTEAEILWGGGGGGVMYKGGLGWYE